MFTLTPTYDMWSRAMQIDGTQLLVYSAEEAAAVLLFTEHEKEVLPDLKAKSRTVLFLALPALPEKTIGLFEWIGVYAYGRRRLLGHWLAVFPFQIHLLTYLTQKVDSPFPGEEYRTPSMMYECLPGMSVHDAEHLAGRLLSGCMYHWQAIDDLRMERGIIRSP